MAGHDAWAMEVDDFEPIGAMPPGIGDVVAYGKQLSKDKNVSKQTRDVARKTLALVACVELSLVTIWSGRLQPACHAVTAHGRAFADCTQQSVVDAAALVAAAAVLSPERQRGDLLDAAQRMLDLEGAFAARLTDGDGDKPQVGGEPSPQVAGEGTVAARAAREATKLRTSTDARSTLAQGRKQKLTFARTPPPPGPAPRFSSSPSAGAARAIGSPRGTPRARASPSPRRDGATRGSGTSRGASARWRTRTSDGGKTRWRRRRV